MTPTFQGTLMLTSGPPTTSNTPPTNRQVYLGGFELEESAAEA